MSKSIYSSSVEGTEGTEVVCKVRDLELVMDKPISSGGGNKGMTPVELLLSSLGG